MQKAGQIDSSININPYSKNIILYPEKSIGTIIDFDNSRNNHAILKMNFFRINITNLLESHDLPVNKTNKQSIYSFKNLNKVFTGGYEASFTYNFYKHFPVYGGYQYLLAKDKEIIQKIKDGKLYKRDPASYNTTLFTKNEYKDSYNRSRNNTNLRFKYNNILYKASVFITAKYRGSYGYSGLNGFRNRSGIYDDGRESVNGFVLLSTTTSKQIATYWEAQQE